MHSQEKKVGDYFCTVYYGKNQIQKGLISDLQIYRCSLPNMCSPKMDLTPTKFWLPNSDLMIYHYISVSWKFQE